MLPGLTGFSWNPTAQRYIDNETGRFVSSSAIRGALEDVIDLAGANMNALTQKLIDNEISLSAWQAGMMEQIKASHVASSALANGGWAQMDQSDWGAVGHLVRDQYDYIRNLSQEIADGTQALDGRLLVRADMYADASNGTYWEMTNRSYLAEGYTEGRRLLEPGADHCDDCLEYASEGWMPIEDIPEIGNSQCLTRCRCEIEYRKNGENE